MESFGISFNFIAIHILHKGASLIALTNWDLNWLIGIKITCKLNRFSNVNILVSFKIFKKRGVFRHFLNILPVLVVRETHHIENSNGKMYL